MKYRNKLITIEAIEFQTSLGINRILNWLSQQGANITGWVFHDGEILIPDGDDMLKAADGDFIIATPWSGQFEVCKKENFNLLYEPYDTKKTKEFEAVLVLKDLLKYAERNTCLHENTYRGGSIWEICEDCGARWADDMGGKPINASEWPKEIKAAQDYLQKLNK